MRFLLGSGHYLVGRNWRKETRRGLSVAHSLENQSFWSWKIFFYGVREVIILQSSDSRQIYCQFVKAMTSGFNVNENDSMLAERGF